MDQTQHVNSDVSKLFATALVTLLVGLIIGFFVGIQFQKSQTTGTGATTSSLPGAGQTRTRQGFPRQGGGFTGRGGTTGTIASVNGNSMVVTLADGGSQTVNFDGNTPVTQQSPASTSDLTAGKTVQVLGDMQNSNTTASRIIITG